MKLLKTTDELIEHMKAKGIKFNITTEEDAKMFLQNNNYYMKLASYRANYDKHKGDDKYINLDFVRDEDEQLYINNTEFAESMADEHWVAIEEEF